MVFVFARSKVGTKRKIFDGFSLLGHVGAIWRERFCSLPDSISRWQWALMIPASRRELSGHNGDTTARVCGQEGWNRRDWGQAPIKIRGICRALASQLPTPWNHRCESTWSLRFHRPYVASFLSLSLSLCPRASSPHARCMHYARSRVDILGDNSILQLPGNENQLGNQSKEFLFSSGRD